VDKNHQWFGAVLAVIMITEIFAAICSFGLYQQLKIEARAILPRDQKRYDISFLFFFSEALLS
jgi:hypothetical protein